jgi:two-component system chemotaxis response regulator CheV
VVCEYNNQLNAFLVKEPETLLTRGWEEIKKPEGFQAPSVVAIAYSDSDEMILILDIETILVEVVGMDMEITAEIIEQAAAGCAGKKVLLVDDSNSAMSMMKATMERMGVEYTDYDSAVKALDTLEGQIAAGHPAKFDLVISDIEMPGMDGFTFTRKLRSLAEYKELPIALHSSMSNPTNQQKAEEAGADEFIPKFNPDALSDLVMRLTEVGN